MAVIKWKIWSLHQFGSRVYAPNCYTTLPLQIYYNTFIIDKSDAGECDMYL